MSDDDPPVSAAHRAGQVFVIALCVIAAFLIIASWVALRACRDVADDTAKQAAPAIERGVDETTKALGNAK